MRVVSFSEARSQFKRVIDQAVDDCDATLIHRRDGENAVLISEATYNSMVETLYLTAFRYSCISSFDNSLTGVFMSFSTFSSLTQQGVHTVSFPFKS